MRKDHPRYPKHLESVKRSYHANREKVLAYHRTRLYGLTHGEYTAMLEAQGGVCAICGQNECATIRGTVKSLAVDHDHRTGVVRGLLCARCNYVLGRVQDDSDILANAIAYLQGRRG